MAKPYGKIYKNKVNVSIDATDLYNVWPVGSIYISVINVNPSNYFGGVWESFGTGRCLVGVDTSQVEFNTVLKEGGSKYLQNHYHNGTTNEGGYHNHNGVTWGDNYIPFVYTGVGGSNSVFDLAGPGAYNVNYDYAGTTHLFTGYGGAHTHYFETSYAGAGNSENLQPYITVYMWKRIS